MRINEFASANKQRHINSEKLFIWVLFRPKCGGRMCTLKSELYDRGRTHKSPQIAADLPLMINCIRSGHRRPTKATINRTLRGLQLPFRECSSPLQMQFHNFHTFFQTSAFDWEPFSQCLTSGNFNHNERRIVTFEVFFFYSLFGLHLGVLKCNFS